MRIIPQSVAEMIAVGLLPYPVKSIEEHGDGLMNCTYKIITKSSDHPNYLLQKINSRVFKDVDALQNNIKLITDHIRKKLELQGSPDLDKRVLTPASIHFDGSLKPYYWDHNDDYWRLYVFIEDTKTYNSFTNAEMAVKAGKAFAEFHYLLSDFNHSGFKEILPDFHNTPLRVKNLQKRVDEDKFDRLKNAEQEADFLLSMSKRFGEIASLADKGKLPKRVIHQDPKLNNLLFDKYDQPVCVIDLDTVMHGYIFYDIGDAIRNNANTGNEDDQEAGNVSLNFEIFKALIDGYSSIARHFITKEEIDTLAYGPLLLTYEQAVRFLADYLNNDKYYKYKTYYPEHNLVRARAQIQLLRSIDSHYDLMKEYVLRCFSQ